MFCCVVYNIGNEKDKPYIQMAHNLMKSFNLFNPDIPSVLYTFGVDEKKVKAMIDDNINVIADKTFGTSVEMFIYRSKLVAEMIDEWGWCILIDPDTLVRKPLDGLIKLVDRPEPTMAAYHRPMNNRGYNCGVMAMNSGAKEVLKRWSELQYTSYEQLQKRKKNKKKKKKKEYPLCYEQTAWVMAAEEFKLSIKDYGRSYNDMPEGVTRLPNGNGEHGDGAIWHSKSKHIRPQWKNETKRIMELCNAAKK